MAEHCDVVVLGLGVAGEEVGGRLAQAGLSVVGVEARLVGGECPYWGCIPSKMMIRAANLLAEAHRVPGMAGEAVVTADYSPVAARLREATDGWDDKVAVNRFTSKGGKFVRGWGRVVRPGVVEVDGREFEAKRGVVVSTGTKAVIPPIEGLAGTPYWTNRQAIEAAAVPQSLVLLGGGAIGLELSQVFARFGTEVTIVEMGQRLLAQEEPESSALAAKVLAADGIRIHTEHPVKSVSYDGGLFSLDEGFVTAEKLLVATGRKPELESIGLEKLGKIEVDEWMRAGEKLWAVGDIAGHGAFTHMAMYEADIVVRDILGQGGPSADYRALPRVTFIDPEIGAVGLTEAQARQQFKNVQTGLAEGASVTRGWIHQGEGFIKVVADADRGVLVGGTTAGPMGGEVLSGLAVAVHGEVPIERLIHMPYAYPTFHRGIQAALQSLS
jgi:pyruvate/2-oxoglutarate dehydrogenase complex dihydrolipoamide dehydrogenase (E3) component